MMMKILRPFVLLIWAIAMFPLTSVAQQTLQQKLASLGIVKEQCTDWSDSAVISLPMPICAYANVTGITAMPTNKEQQLKGWMEMYDGHGNYFKKRVVLALQGQSSVGLSKKHFKADFFEEDWDGEATPEIKFGNWVEQDAFHFKAFYRDFFRGTGIMSYRIYDQLTIGRGEYGRIWERATNIKNPDLDALCHPDAFPCLVYLNGKLHGIFCWQLKKHRKNMNMKKNTPEHIHLDTVLAEDTTLYGGVVKWKHFEIKTPKNLYTVNGKAYDSENPTELIDESSAFYNLDTDDENTKKYKANSAKVKKYIINLSNYKKEIQTLINNKASNETIREAIAERFDVVGMIDYMIHNIVTNNFDGLKKNYQLFTYDGKKWFVAPYDLDNTFGYFPYYSIVFSPNFYCLGNLTSFNFKSYFPFNFVDTYFKQDIRDRYAKLRDEGLLNPEIISSMFSNWYYDIGLSNYADEWKKWPKSPCLLETIANSPWELQTYNATTYNKTKDYSSSTQYAAGDITKAGYRLWEAKSATKGVRPYKQIGCKDSLARIYPWVKDRLVQMDKLMAYSFTSLPSSYTLHISSVGWSTICLPFQFVIPEGLELYTVLGIDKDGHLIKEQVETPEAYKPYLVKGNLGQYVLVGERENPDAMGEDYLVNGALRGCLTSMYAPMDCYVLQNHNGKTAFYHVAANGKVMIGANRAYLVTDTPSKTNAIEMEMENGPTSVEMVEACPEIIGIFSTNGTQKERMSKGVNIIKYSNGKTVKVVVK